MQAQLTKNIHSVRETPRTPLYALLARLIFQASTAALFTPEAGDDAALFEAFQAFDQHMPLALGGYKVTLFKVKFFIYA